MVRVAGGERRAELVREQVRRRVERRDRQRDSRRGPVGQRGIADAAAPPRHRQQLAADPARLGRADREGVRDPVDLAAAVLDRLAELEREQGRERVAALGREPGGPVKDAGAGGRGEPGHRRRRVPGVADRRCDVGRAGRAARLTTRRTYGPVRSAHGPSRSHSPATSAGAEAISSVITMVHLTVQLNRYTDWV